MRRKRILGLAVSLMVTLLLVALPTFSLAAEITLKLGHVTPPGSSIDVSCKKFVERVAINTGNKVEIKIFGGAQFGNNIEHWAQIKSGAIDLYWGDTTEGSLIEPAPKNFFATSAAYVFDSSEHRYKFYKSDLFKMMMGKVEQAGNVKFIGYMGDRAFRGFSTTNKRITTPNEIKGLKLSVPGVPIFVEVYKAWGANPTPVRPQDFYTALKSGMVDGLDFEMTALYSTKYYEIQKYFIATEYMRSGVAGWINANKWESLPEYARTAFLKSAQETELYVNKFTAQDIIETEKGLAKAGVEIVRPDLKPWKEVAESWIRKNEGNIWEKGLYDKIRALK